MPRHAQSAAVALGASVLMGMGPVPEEAAAPPARDTRISPSGVARSESDPFAPAVQEFNRKRAQFELEVRRLRVKHFANIRHLPTRQAGIAKLQTFTAPEAFAPLINILGDEEDDVRLAMLDHLAAQPDARADAVLAWAAVFDKREPLRVACRERLKARAAAHEVPAETRSMIAEGLRSADAPTVADAGELAAALNQLDAMPMMIRAQVNERQAPATGGGGLTAGGGGGSASLASDSALAYIFVGRQITFVADLTPVVGQNAVAFDPTIGVLTEGTVLRITDAVVKVYNVALHNTLSTWASAAWGRPTDHLGWDINAWLAWYHDDLLPHIAAQRAAAERANGAAPASP